jgi:hypothetical protein
MPAMTWAENADGCPASRKLPGVMSNRFLKFLKLRNTQPDVHPARIAKKTVAASEPSWNGATTHRARDQGWFTKSTIPGLHWGELQAREIILPHNSACQV